MHAPRLTHFLADGAFTLALLALCAVARADLPPTGYDVMRIDFPAEQTAKTFAGCTFYPANLPTYVIWCDATYPATYVEPSNAGTPVLLGTIDQGFDWFSDLMGACRLQSMTVHDTYTSFAFACYTDRISSDGFEP